MKLHTKILGFFAMFFMLTFSLAGCDGSSSGCCGLPDGTFTKTVLPGDEEGLSNTFGLASESRYQFLILADDMEGSGYITAVSFSYDSVLVSNASCPNVTIKMGHTSLSALTDTYASNVEEGRGTHETVLDNAAVTIPAGSEGDFFAITLDNSFYYNGVDNVIVEIVRTSSCSPDVSITAGDSLLAVPYNAVLWTTTSSTETTGALGTDLPNMEFYFEGGDNTLFSNPSGSAPIPFTDDTNDQRQQQLYLASDINGSGPITGLGIQVGIPTSEETYTVSVKLGHATVTTLALDYAANYSDSPVTVANAVSFTIPANVPANSYVWIPLPDAVFTYNGTDNLILEFDVTAATGDTSYTFHDPPGADVRMIYGPSNASVINDVEAAIQHSKFRFNGGTMDVITNEQGVLGLPYFSNGDYRTQFMFGAQQFGTGGPVTGISFRLESDSMASDYPSATVVLGHTANTVLSITFADNMMDPTTVFTGTLNVPAGLKAGDWVNIPVSGFTYDPTQNLVVEVAQDRGAETNNILSSSADVPGASGAATGPRGNTDAAISTPIQSDIRVYLSK